jgi:glycosyltransferase involved in cell wall biosynthesis
MGEGVKCLKVLLSAYACEPGKGSEPGVGWHWVEQIARFHEVWVITRANNRGAIEHGLRRNAMPMVHWVYFDLPRWARFWKKGQRGVHLYYYLWQIGAYVVGRRLHKAVAFDLVHHVTFGVYWQPSFLALLRAPFLWGPVGGGESAPKAFYRTFSLRGRVYECLRDAARWLARRDPFVWLTCHRSILALANTADTEQKLRALGCKNVFVYPHMGVWPDEIRVNIRRQDMPFRVLSVGRFIHWKGFHLGLMAFATLRKAFPASEYWLVGDGPERRNLERLTQRLHVADKVRFWGNLPRHQVLERLAESDVLLHPSLHDSSPAVCLEAMAAGRPVICLDLGGAMLQVTAETGYRVIAGTPGQVLSDLAEAMLRLARDPDLRVRMGTVGRKRVDDVYSWQSKGRFLAELYQEVVSSGYSPPEDRPRASS